MTAPELISVDDLFAPPAQERAGIHYYQWCTDARWLLYLQDTGGDENLRANPQNPDAGAVDLAPFPGAMSGYELDIASGSRLLFRSHPHLDPAVLAPTEPITIRSRDGLDPPGYLTLPLGIEPRNLPLALAVHGGPWTRSAGFGKAFTKAAVGEFAGKMHDDLIDGVDWAVERGYADPDRVAIFGGSYGGYATLVGVTFTPDMFAAAIDYVGASDLSKWHLFIGNPDDPDQLADTLVIQGANDVRVAQAESDNLVEALRARGVDVEYMVNEDECHGFVNSNNVKDMFRAVERFLAQHIGGRA